MYTLIASKQHTYIWMLLIQREMRYHYSWRERYSIIMPWAMTHFPQHGNPSNRSGKIGCCWSNACISLSLSIYFYSSYRLSVYVGVTVCVYIAKAIRVPSQKKNANVIGVVTINGTATISVHHVKWGNEYRAENVHSIERAHYSTVLIGINQSGTRLWSLVQFICSQWKKKGIPFTNILFAFGSDPKCGKCVGKKCNHFLSIIFYRKNVCRPAHKDAYINVLWSHCVADDVISLGRENAYVHIKCLVWLRFYCEFYIQYWMCAKCLSSTFWLFSDILRVRIMFNVMCRWLVVHFVYFYPSSSQTRCRKRSMEYLKFYRATFRVDQFHQTDW